MNTHALSWKGALAVLASGVLMLGLTSCGGGASSDTPANGNGSTAGNMIEFSDKKTEITYFKAKAEMSVDSITLGFMPPADKPLLSDPSEDGNQFVKVMLTFTNTGEEPFKMNYTNVSLNHSAAAEDGITFLVNKGNVEDLLESKELAAGESTSGALYFEVPAADTAANLGVNYSGYDGESTLYTVELN